MSLIPGRARDAGEDWTRIASYLARNGGLSQEDIARIVALKESSELRFSEAALRLGLATQSDIDAALSQTYRAPAEPSARPSSELIVAHDQFHPHSERIRALRTELMLRQAANTTCNVIAIISAGSGEGRSLLAAELAIVFAQLGQPTLLVDADFRKSRQHELFQASNEQGLALALSRSEAPHMQTVHGLPKMLLLTAGRKPDNPLELLSDAMLGDFMAGWTRRYRHIILDTPPVGLFSDALAVATHAGSVLTLTRMNRSTLQSGREMVRRLVVTQARVLGNVISHF